MKEQLAMRVLITDVLDDPDLERAVLSGVEVETLPPGADLLRALEERPAAVLITWRRFDATTLAALGRAGVRGIVCSSVGFDRVDLAGARAAGITVCNVPDYGTDEVADHAVALLLWSLRGLRAAPPSATDARSWWDDRRFGTIPRLQDSTLALLGFGRIGQAVAHRAQAFGLAVRWFDPYVPRGHEKVTRTTRAESLRELLARADALSIHCLLSPETHHVIDAAALDVLPRHAVIVNVSRGAVIEEAALVDALRGGRIAAAGVDVLEDEDPPGGPLLAAYLRGDLPNLLLTPHIAWYSGASGRELRRKSAAEAGRLLRGEQPWNPVS